MEVSLVWWRSKKLIYLYVLVLILLDVIFLNDGFLRSVFIDNRHSSAGLGSFNVTRVDRKRWILTVMMNIHLYTRWLYRAHDPLRSLLDLLDMLIILAGAIVLSDRDFFIGLHLIIINIFLPEYRLFCWTLLPEYRLFLWTLITLPHLLKDQRIAAVTVLGTLHVCALFRSLIKRGGFLLWFINKICLDARVR